MKKSLLLSVAMLVAAQSFAQKPVSLFELLESSKTESGKKAPQGNLQAARKGGMIRIKPAADKTAIKKTVVYGTPDGTLHKNMFRTSTGYTTAQGYEFDTYYDGMIGNVVEGTDGCLYVQDPISSLQMEAWIKLDKVEDGKYVAKFPQDVYEENMEGLILFGQINLLEFYVDPEDPDVPRYKMVTDIPNEAYYTWKDGVLTQDVTDPENPKKYILGATSNYGYGEQEWLGIGDLTNTWRTAEDTGVPVPENVKFDTYTLSHDEGLCKAQVGFDGDNVYVKGLVATNPDGAVRGVIADGKAVFEAGQYLGPDEDERFHEYFRPVKQGWVYDPYWGMELPGTVDADEIVFDFNADSRTLTAADDESAIIVNGGRTPFEIAVYNNPVFEPFADIPRKPMKPYIKEFIPFNEYEGNGYIRCEVYAKDTDGRRLDPDCVFYNMLIDGEVQTFCTDTYLYLKEDITDIPFAFTDQYDIYTIGENLKYLFFYMDGFSTIGVQSYYVGGGEKTYSDVATYTVVTSGLKDSLKDTDVESVTYRDVSGRAVTAGTKGLLIKTVTLSDGSVKTSKVINR